MSNSPDNNAVHRQRGHASIPTAVAPGEVMIEFDNVVKVLGGRAILDRVSFSVKRGETFVVCGPSGVGKVSR